MKLILVLLCVAFAACTLVTQPTKYPEFELCNRCQDLVHAITLYKTYYSKATMKQFSKFVEDTCERTITKEDKELCLIDLKNIPKVWELALGKVSGPMACYATDICTKDSGTMKGIKYDYNTFLDFKKTFGKEYNLNENVRRAKTFFTNLQKIDRLNQQAAARNSTLIFGITEFTDMSIYEWKLKVLSKKVAVADPSAPYVTETNVKDLPTSFDWRTKGAVTPVKNQGQCGSCWSFSTTGNVEGQWFLAGNKLVGLSEQNLVDCDHQCMMYENEQTCDQGCDGGLMPNAFTYIIKNKGIDTEASYPYQAVDGTCQFNRANVGATISNYTMVSKNETTMAEYLVAHGPLSIAADAQEWQFYVGGVFDLPCGKTLDHGILIVGYGVHTDLFGFHIPFWWVKNSWGASWGEHGYLKIKRGDCKCGLCEFVCSSIV